MAASVRRPPAPAVPPGCLERLSVRGASQGNGSPGRDPAPPPSGRDGAQVNPAAARAQPGGACLQGEWLRACDGSYFRGDLAIAEAAPGPSAEQGAGRFDIDPKIT
ncbi:uncharacterized protein ACIGJ3_019897 isoform 1-T1 [Trichechus inunguis]